MKNEHNHIKVWEVMIYHLVMRDIKMKILSETCQIKIGSKSSIRRTPFKNPQDKRYFIEYITNIDFNMLAIIVSFKSVRGSWVYLMMTKAHVQGRFRDIE